jgi:hypothetical protein
MAKAKTAKKTTILGKPKKGERTYTKSKLVAHLAAKVADAGLGEVSKKQVACVLEELTNTLKTYAVVGAPIPGLGKMVLREIPAKPARTIMSFGKEIKVAAKPKRVKVVFRFNKDTKESFNNK